MRIEPSRLFSVLHERAKAPAFGEKTARDGLRLTAFGYLSLNVYHGLLSE